MSRATLRRAIVSTFGGGAVDGLTDVYPSEKKFTSGDEWYRAVGDSSGALGFVFIEREREARRTFAADVGGWKKISYEVGLVLRYRHNGNDAVDEKDAGLVVIDEWDALLENVKWRCRDHRTMANAVFQIGEGDTISGDDIEILSDLPMTDKEGYIHVWGVVRFKVIEWVQS